MTLIDTSGNYGDGRSEKLIGRAIAGQRDREGKRVVRRLPWLSPVHKCSKLHYQATKRDTSINCCDLILVGDDLVGSASSFFAVQPMSAKAKSGHYSAR